jgi:lytic murein transglycosylase
LFWFLSSFSVLANESLVPCGGSFDTFLEKIAEQALDMGLSSKVISNSVFNTKYLKEVVRLDKNQKSFRLSFSEFTNRSVNEYRLVFGKKNIELHKKLFDKIKSNYGIPAEVITSLWAMETDYGANLGDFHTLSALGTLAHNCRRSDLFQSQYLAAIRLVENKVLSAEESLGAWAGEFGQIQMLPLDILNFGSDGDSNGKIELVKSSKDTIATAAKLIQSKGWQVDQPWIEEVVVTKEFPWRETGLGRPRTVMEWKKLGVSLRNSKVHQRIDDLKANLILPQGRKGPKFFAFPNFRIFMEWNNSFMYSTTAAYLANRLKGDPEYITENPADILKVEEMIILQKLLRRLGYQVGRIDGILGANTRQSVRKVQMSLGLPADSWPTIKLLQMLATKFR